MAVRLLDALQQFFDDSGDPLAGGFIYTYEASPSPSIPLVTYQDADGLVPHANPIELDASGYPPNPIYYTEDVAYALVKKNANDVMLDQVLNVLIVGSSSGANPDSAYTDKFYYQGGPPSATEELYRTAYERAVTYPANFTGAVGSVRVPPTTSFAATMRKNGVICGTITFAATSGAFSITSAAGASIAFSANDVLTVEGPALADATIAGISVTWAGEKT